MANERDNTLEITEAPVETSEVRELGELGRGAAQQEVESYGIHRFSTATRLVVTVAIVAVVTAAIFAVVQIIVTLIMGSELAPETYIGMLVAALLAAGVAILAGFLLARGITEPIAKITNIVKQIKSGNLSARTGFTGYDEIGRLGATLDSMADAIERNTEYERQITVDVAHELRTPLMAMQANLEAMIDDVMPTDAEHLNIVNTEVVRLGRLVEAQLHLSRLEARKTEFLPRVLNLGEHTAHLVSSYKLLVEGSNLELEFVREPNVLIYADPDMLRQAAANLISNAVRYTPEGGRLLVAVRSRNGTAELEVSDTGIGLSKEELGKIFTKFWRSDDNRNSDHGGLGIGLSMVREIVNIHGGKINVQSRLGVGSSFTLVFPVPDVRLF